jgi:ribosomal protein L40E
MVSQSTSSGPSCSSCGAGLRPNAKFCTKCGTKV